METSTKDYRLVIAKETSKPILDLSRWDHKAIYPTEESAMSEGRPRGGIPRKEELDQNQECTYQTHAFIAQAENDGKSCVST